MKNKLTGNLILSIFLLFTALACTQQTTLAGKSKRSLEFIVLGDWGMQGDENQKQIARQMDRLAADNAIDFIVTTGDNFYPFGVKSAADPLWEKAYESVYALPHLQDIPWYITLGNHDYFGEIQAEIDYARTHPRWILPATYHSRDFMLEGRLPVRLLFADSNPYIKEYHLRPDLYHHIGKQDVKAQTAWLEQQLRDDDPVWKLVFAHHPLYTSGEHGNAVDLIEAWSGLFTDAGVDAFFAGHDHHLEHIKTPAPTHYFISGGGGARTRTVGKGPDTLFSLQSHGFVHVKLDAACMRVRFINQEGVDVYTTSVAAVDGQSCE